MKIFKKITAFVIALTMILSLSGCLLQIDQEKNREIVIVSIDGGEHEIKKGEYLDMLNYQIAFYNAYYANYYGAYTQENLDNWKNEIVTSLIDDMICEIEMDNMNFQISEEDREKAREDFEEAIEDYAEQLESEAKKEAEAEEEESDDAENKDEAEDKVEEEERDFMQEARDYYADLIKEQDMTEEEYIDELAQPYRLERFKKFVMGDINITDEDIKKYYDDELDAQKLKPDLDADVLIYEPSGVSYKVIKVMLTEEEQEEYDKLAADTEKKDEAKAYLEKTSKVRAQAYLDRINNGESFEDVLADANKFLVENCGVKEDDIEKQEEALKLYKTVGSTGFAGTLDSDLLSAAKDTVTGVIDAEKGVYVIGKCYGRFESTTHAYEKDNDIYKEIKEHLEDEYVSENWETKLTELKNKHDIKTYTARINKNY